MISRNGCASQVLLNNANVGTWLVLHSLRAFFLSVCFLLFVCKCQEESEPSATTKLSQFLTLQTIMTLRLVFANFGESESSRPPSSECGYDEPVDLRVLLSF